MKNEQTTINLTISDYVYEKVKKEADEAGISLNQLIQEKIVSINY
jgi:predicted HicB family RNase H-like nuclease